MIESVWVVLWMDDKRRATEAGTGVYRDELTARRQAAQMLMEYPKRTAAVYEQVVR